MIFSPPSVPFFSFPWPPPPPLVPLACSRMKKKVKEAIKKRNLLNDNFRNLNGYSWDYVLVFKVFGKDEKLNPQQKIWTFKKIISALADGGIETKVFYNSKVILVMMRSSPLDSYSHSPLLPPPLLLPLLLHLSRLIKSLLNFVHHVIVLLLKLIEWI